MMDSKDLLIVIVFGPPLWILMGWLGHIARRRYLRSDMPYEWRVKNGPKGSYMSFGGGAIPNIPKGRWW